MLKSLAELGRLAGAGAEPAFEGERILLDIDGLLCIAAALWRARKIKKAAVRRMAARAAAVMRKRAPDLLRWAEFAAQTRHRFGPDPDLPFLFDWWEGLARLAAGRLEVEAAVRRVANREVRRRRSISRYVGSALIPDGVSVNAAAAAGLLGAGVVDVLIVRDAPGSGPRVGPPLLSARRAAAAGEFAVPAWWLAKLQGTPRVESLGDYLGLPSRTGGRFDFPRKSVSPRPGVDISFSPVFVSGGSPMVCVQVVFGRKRAGRTVTAWLGRRANPFEAVVPGRSFEVKLPVDEVVQSPFAIAQGDELLWMQAKAQSPARRTGRVQKAKATR